MKWNGWKTLFLFISFHSQLFFCPVAEREFLLALNTENKNLQNFNVSLLKQGTWMYSLCIIQKTRSFIPTIFQSKVCTSHKQSFCFYSNHATSFNICSAKRTVVKLSKSTMVDFKNYFVSFSFSFSWKLSAVGLDFWLVQLDPQFGCEG